MAEIKTKKTEENFAKFLNTIHDEGKRKDCFAIAEMMQNVLKCEPQMWGSAIVGFGYCHYKYESGHEGDMCMIGFSPRKQNITLYISGGINKHPDLLEKLGKYKTGKRCLYAYTHMKNKYG